MRRNHRKRRPPDTARGRQRPRVHADLSPYPEGGASRSRLEWKRSPIPAAPPEWKEPLARVGLVAKGISYGLVGALALKLALGDGGAATSNQGAMQHLAGTSFGTILLVLLAIGLAAYAVWRLIQAWHGDVNGSSMPRDS